jgi:hypothetical protein
MVIDCDNDKNRHFVYFFNGMNSLPLLQLLSNWNLAQGLIATLMGHFVHGVLTFH